MKFLNALFEAIWDIDIIAMLLAIAMALVALKHSAHANEVRTVKLNQTSVAKVVVTPGRSTILSFPTRPTKVILGNQGLFSIEYVENDLAVAALSLQSKSNLFVYLDGRRFAFNLVAALSGGDTIILVRDAPNEPSSDLKRESKWRIHHER